MPSAPADRVFLVLSSEWAIGYDPLQWIVYKRRKRREDWYWNPIGYISSSRDLLRLLLQEKHAQLPNSAWQAIDALPAFFQEWYTQHTRNNSTGVDRVFR